MVQALESESGVPLADADRWSERLGADVSGARVATGPAAAQAAASIDANAFTVGNRVFFGAGKGPHTRGGALLRHELAHVVQQASAHMPPYEQLALTTPGDAFEREADGSAAPVQAAGQAVLARDTGPDGGIDAKEWVEVNAARLRADIAGMMQVIQLPTPGAYAAWRPNAGQFALAATQALLGDADLWTTLPRFIAPAPIQWLVQKGRNLTGAGGTSLYGPPDYDNNVPLELRTAMTQALAASLDRVFPRYLRARNQRALEDERFTGQCPLQPPEIEPADVIASQPLDRDVIRALCSGVVAFDVHAYRAVYADGVIETGVDTLHPVVFSFDLTPGSTSWLSVISPQDATAEEVARELYGDETLSAHIIAAPPLFGFKPRQLTAEHKDAWAQQTGQDPDNARAADPTEQALTGPAADDIMKAQAESEAAGASGEASASAAQVVEAIRESIGLLRDIERDGEQVYGSPYSLAPVIERIEARSEQLAAGDDASTAGWAKQVLGQRSVLGDAATGIASLREQKRELTRGAQDGMQALPDYIMGPLREWALEYLLAARYSELVATGRAHNAAAEQKASTFSIDMVDGILMYCREVIHGARDKDTFGSIIGKQDPLRIQLLKDKEQELRVKLSAAREILLHDPQLVKKLMADVFADVSALQDQTFLLGTIESIVDLWKQMLDLYSGWGVITGKNDNYFDMQGKLAVYLERWTITLAKYGNPKYQEEAKKELVARRDEIPEIKQLFDDAVALIQDEEDFERWVDLGAKLVGLVAIAIVTAGVGAYVEGALLIGAGWGATTTGVVAAGAVTAGAEALTFTALTTAVFEENPTLGRFLTQLGENWALFGAMRFISMGAQVKAAMAESKLAAAGWKGGAHVANLTVVLTHSVITADREKRARTGQGLTDEEMATVAAEGMAVFVGILIANRCAGKFMAELRAAGAESWVGKLATVDASRAEAFQLAHKLQSVKGKEPAERLLAEALAKDGETMRSELTLLREVKAWAETNPGKAALMGVEAGALDSQIKDHEGIIDANERAQIARELESIGGDQFACPSERFDGFVERFRELGDTVDVSVDPVSKVKVATITPEKGRAMTLRERVAEGSKESTIEAKGEETKSDRFTSEETRSEETRSEETRGEEKAVEAPIPESDLQLLHRAADSHVDTALRIVKERSPDLEAETKTVAYAASEAKYREKIAEGAAAKKTRKAAGQTAKKAARDHAAKLAEQLAREAADRAIDDGTAFDMSAMPPDAQTQLTAYNADASGGAAKRLAPQLANQDLPTMQRLLAREVAFGKATKTTSEIPDPTDPARLATQTQEVYSFSDGTLIRIKPKGDRFYRGKPMFSIEVKQVAPSDALPGQPGIAFKVDASSRAVPKGPGDINNPYNRGTFPEQWDIFQKSIMKSGHQKAKTP